MKRLSVLIFVLLSFYLRSQPIPGCNQSTVVPSYIFPPNSTSTVTPTTFFPNDIAYLCGPNTVVYDTVGPQTSFVYVNSACTYITNGGSSIFYCVYFVKNNGTIIIRPDASPFALSLVVEPTATVVNQTTVTIPTTTCSNIIFPTVSCSLGIPSYEKTNSLFHCWPNPANEKLNIEYTFEKPDKIELEIINYLGKIILHTNYKEQIDITFLPSGIYNVRAITNERQIYSTKFIKE